MKSTRPNLLSAWLLATALVAGCQSNPAQWNDQVRGTIDTSLQQAQPKDTKTGVPSDVTQELLPPLEITVEGGQATPVEPRFDLSVANASARQVFMGIVEGTPYDIVLQPDVGGTVTLNLKNVTVPEALNALRDAYGYEYRRDGNRFFILGRELQTRIFTVNYLNLTRKGKSDTHVKSGDISGMTSGSSGSGSGGTGTSNIEVETQSQSDFWKELGETLKAIVGGSGDHRVVINAQAGLVVVRAMPDELRLVENYLGATHASIQRQVVLEAKIIEVELNDRFQTGINWARIGTNSSFSQTGGGTATSASGWLGDIAGNSGNLDPSSLFSNTDASAFGGIFSLAVKSGNFAAFVELLKTQGQVQVLSSPRVSTVNNQKAVIKVGGDDFFVTSVTSASSSSTSSSGPSIELTSFFSGIALDVTPQIDENNNIVLHIHPSVSTVTEKNKTVTISGEGFVLPLASSAIQESDNIVRAQSSQIIVIGGLMKEASTEDNASVPLLGDIPVLGNLFKHKKITRVKRELVILLKPTIINTPDQWGNEVKDAQERIKKIKLGS